jgi:hypothetical protein
MARATEGGGVAALQMPSAKKSLRKTTSNRFHQQRIT